MTATQSQIRDALDDIALWGNADNAWRIFDEHEETIRTILQSALDTQKPAGDAAEALDWFNGILDVFHSKYEATEPDKEAEHISTIRAALTGDCGGGDFDLDQLLYRCDKLGTWMAAALGDENVCAEMKADIDSWFRAVEALTTTTASTAWTIQQHLNNIALFKSRLANPSYSRLEDQNYMRMEINKAEAAIEELKNANQ